MNKSRLLKGQFRWLLSLLIAAGFVFALFERQAISDWWILHSYQPTAEVQTLAQATTMTAEGTHLFYVSQAQVDDKQQFNRDCPTTELRETLTLGCYTHAHIYVLKVAKLSLAASMRVSAAHEMLHAAYSRLSDNERAKIDNLIRSFYPTIKDKDFKELIATYQRTEPGQLLNELHSLIPSEIETISPELESYYRQYFSDRQQIVKAFQAYRSVFKHIDDHRAELLGQLSDLKHQIDSLEVDYNAASAQADSLSAQISALRQQGKVEESNQLVSAQNAAASQANRLASQITALIDQYNQLVGEINSLALEENDLVSSLDSHSFEH